MIALELLWRDHLDRAAISSLLLTIDQSRGPDAAFQKDGAAIDVYINSCGKMCAYHIGIDGKPWGEEERAAWRSEVNQVKRSYQDEVVAKLDLLDKNVFEVAQYGSLDYIDGGSEKYKLFYVKSKDWDSEKPTILVTGGVHGYETSGVQGALLFLSTVAPETYSKKFNIVCCPCVSPWGYECIQRWNYNAEDPNRGFFPQSSRMECSALMALAGKFGVDSFTVHIDLHETTDTDESEFRPAKMARMVFLETRNNSGWILSCWR